MTITIWMIECVVCDDFFITEEEVLKDAYLEKHDGHYVIVLSKEKEIGSTGE